jgi:phosphate-selective porin OprO/OprP
VALVQPESVSPPPTPGLAVETLPALQIAQAPTEQSADAQAQAKSPTEPARSPRAQPSEPDPERERRREVLDDVFEELSEDAPPPVGTAPEEVDEPSSAPVERSPGEVGAPQSPTPSEAPAASEPATEPPPPIEPEPSTPDHVEPPAPKSREARITHETFEELSEDAPDAEPPAAEPKTAGQAPAPKATPGEAAAVEPTADEKPKLSVRWDRGLRVERSDGSFRLKIGGRLFVDVASISGDRAIESNFETGGFIDARQARIDFTGTWGTRFYYRLQVDLTGTSSTGRSRNEYLKSAFVGYVGPRWFGQAEVGVLKEPFSMGVLTSGLNTDFLERALPTLFGPAFNPGILIRNNAFDDRMFWAVGVFRFWGNDAAAGRFDVAARLGGVPWSSDDGSDFLHIAASYVAKLGSDLNLDTGSRPETFFGDKWVEIDRFSANNGHLIGTEFAGVWHGFSYQSEIILSIVDRQAREGLLLWGAYAQVSYFITGEQRRYLKRQGVFGRLAINQPFSFKKRTWGAWELTGRYSYLDLDDQEIRGGILNDFSVGLNWYLLRNVRTMANYVHSHVNGLGTGHVFSVRFQIDY